MSIIKSFTLEKHEQEIFDETNGEFLNKALDHSRWNAKSFAVVNTITDIAPLISNWLCGLSSYSWTAINRCTWLRFMPILSVYTVHYVD